MIRMRARRGRISHAALLLAGIVPLVPAYAQGWPLRPVRLVVPQSPGASTDLIARVLAARLAESLAQSVVVDNRPGAGSILGTRAVIDAEPDGHTLLVVAASITINPSLHRKPPFDTVRDLAPITQLSVYPNLLVVHPSVSATSVQSLLALARRPGVSLNYGSSGTGTGTHLSAELFRHMTGASLTHIPYKGGGPSVQALLGGEVQLAFATLPSVLPYVRSGKLRAIAVTGANRISGDRGIPTVAESGVPGFDLALWHGLLGPRGLPRPITDRLNAELNRVLKTKEMIDRLEGDGLSSVGGTPEQFGERIARDIALYRTIVAKAGIKAD